MKVNARTSLALVTLMLGVAAQAFAAPALRSVTVADQTPLPAAPGSTAAFLVTVTHTGYGSLNAYLKVAGLPEGATAHFSPSVLRFTDQLPSAKVATLFITTLSSTPPGTYDFTVIARHGASPKVLYRTAALVLGAHPIIPERPVITSLVKQEDGSMKLTGIAGPNQLVLIQATTDLSLPDWQTIGTTTADGSGILAFIDVDAAIMPCRFYRLAAPAVILGGVSEALPKIPVPL